MSALKTAVLAFSVCALPVAAQLSPQLAPQGEVPTNHALSLAGPGPSVLPDAPSAAWSSSQDQAGGQPSAATNSPVAAEPVAKHFATTIQAGQSAVKLSAGDKFQIGIRRQLTLGAFATSTASAGWAHLNDNRPHYGTDSGGFGERLGAANLKQTSQSVFLGAYSNLFHQDPRYYVLGPQERFKKRAIYAASTVVLTRNDGGKRVPNWSLFSAVASSAALTNAYYPTRDRSVDRTVVNVFTTLATRMATQELREFGADIRARIHFKH